MATSRRPSALGIGIAAGLVGGITSWIYELVVWVHFLQLKKSPYDLVVGTASLAFGKRAEAWPGAVQILVSVAVHFGTSLFWGVLFALLWPFFRRRQAEATLVALFFGVFAWVFMHNVLLAAFAPNPPTYTTYSVLNGLVSHTFAFSVPIALVVKRLSR